jgi:hypothetical protein
MILVWLSSTPVTLESGIRNAMKLAMELAMKVVPGDLRWTMLQLAKLKL